MNSLEFSRIWPNWEFIWKICIHTRYKYIKNIYIQPFPWNLWANVYEILFRWSTRGFQHTLMLFGRMCHQWWSYLFLIGSLTSIQLLLGFQRKFAERKYSTCSKSCVCFSCCSVYKDDRPGFWSADTLSDSLQPEAYNLHASSNKFFFNLLKCYFRVSIFAYSSHTVSN